jgi:hypothetical protein
MAKLIEWRNYYRHRMAHLSFNLNTFNLLSITIKRISTLDFHFLKVQKYPSHLPIFLIL